jgi:hypothetical protein
MQIIQMRVNIIVVNPAASMPLFDYGWASPLNRCIRITITTV